MADEKKVMDVAKPGESKPETGSKPMVIGHKSMAADPTIRQNETEDSKETAEAPKSPPKKITLAPISEDLKPETPKEESKTAEKPAETASTEEKPSEKVDKVEEKGEKVDDKVAATPEKTEPKDPEPKPEETPAEETSDDPVEDTAQDKDKKAAEEEEARQNQENHLKEIIKKKEYYVPIKEHSASSSAKVFLITFLLVCLVGLGIIALLIDAEIIDLGIELPFNLIK